jgi:hypothetical protein
MRQNITTLSPDFLRRSTHLSFALKGLERERVRIFRQVAQKLEGLPRGHDPDVVHGHEGVEERLEADLVVRLREPGGVVEQAERGSENGRFIKKINLI